MFSETQNGKAILDRIIEAYGVATKKELSEKLETSPSSVSSWALRDTVPGDIIIKCAMETHRSLHWLMTGKEEFEKSNSDDVKELPRFEAKKTVQLKGQALYEQVLSSGGKAILERIMQAYGFTKQKELADLLGISTATISTWIRREYFPGDVVVACALDTGVSLQWLTSNSGSSRLISPSNFIEIPKYELSLGNLLPSGSFYLDKSTIRSDSYNPIYIYRGDQAWVINLSNKNFGNGLWLVDVDGSIDIHSVYNLPGGKVRLSLNEQSFECDIKDVKLVGNVLIILNFN